MPKHFVTLGMFIIDQFQYLDEQGNPTGRSQVEQIGGGGTYAAIGARIWLPAKEVGMIVDRGPDFPPEMQAALDTYGKQMWHFRQRSEGGTTRALNLYRGEQRGFEYLTPRVRLSPQDLGPLGIARPTTLHFICSPKRASEIIAEVDAEEGWHPVTIFEPIPDRCVPAELPALKEIVHRIEVLSPNALEALSLLSLPPTPTKELIEQACDTFLDMGVGKNAQGSVVIRSGELGAFVKRRGQEGRWVDPYWTTNDAERVVDVTGAGNSFLGGFAAGLLLGNGDIYEATLYASVSASFTIEQPGLPLLSPGSEERWNGDDPKTRLEQLRDRLKG